LDVDIAMHYELIFKHWQLFLDGYKVTVTLLFVVFSVSMVLAIILAIFRSSDRSVLRHPIRGYTYFMRGTPLLLQVYIIYYGLSQFESVRTSIFWPLLSEAWFCIALGLILNNTAYLTEIIQGALREVPKAIIEGAKSLGMSPTKTFLLVVCPLALRRSIPALSNEFIFVMHSTAVASTITVVDILGAGRKLNTSYYLAYEGFITAAVLYVSIAFSASYCFRALEKRYLDPLSYR